MKKQNTAHWTQITHLFRADEYICSVCGHKASRPVSPCPSCGSTMGGSKYDANWVDEMEMLDIIFGDWN